MYINCVVGMGHVLLIIDIIHVEILLFRERFTENFIVLHVIDLSISSTDSAVKVRKTLWLAV